MIAVNNKTFVQVFLSIFVCLERRPILITDRDSPVCLFLISNAFGKTRAVEFYTHMPIFIRILNFLELIAWLLISWIITWSQLADCWIVPRNVWQLLWLGILKLNRCCFDGIAWKKNVSASRKDEWNKSTDD